MCLFGPPKELMSDQGKEFLNQVVAELTRVTGVDHITTSSYNARCSGQVERTNQTVISTLRKLVDQDNDNWDLYIPGALL